MTKQLETDKYGIINNRGASKYLGVSFSSNLGRWFVSIHQGYKNGLPNNKSFYFNGCRGSELHAAQISRELHKLRANEGKIPETPFDVKMDDGVIYTIYPYSNMMRREKIATTSQPKQNVTVLPNPQQNLFDREAMSSFSNEEKELIQSVLSTYIDGKLSKNAVSLLQKVTSIMDT